jgi:hypothetical protein
MLAKIISALALTLLLTGGALAYAPQPHNNIIYTGHANSVQPEQSLQTEPFAANAAVFEQQPHNIYAGHSNSVQAQESLELETQPLFAANTALSEPLQFD